MPWATYQIPDLSWSKISVRVAEAEDKVARLDERLLKSEIREGWRHRTDFLEVISSVWLDGEAVHLDDLVLHDAMMDNGAPTAELTRAHAVLRLRRRIAASVVDWRTSAAAVMDILGRNTSAVTVSNPNEESGQFDPSDELEVALTAIDRAMLRSEGLLERTDYPVEQVGVEKARRAERIEEWLQIVQQTAALPPTIAAVIAQDAWTEIAPLGFDRGEGRLLAASLLSLRRKTVSHMTLWSVGERTVPLEHRRGRQTDLRYAAGLSSLVAAAEEGMRRHETWLTAKRLLARKARGRRSTSHLPALIDLLIGNPLVSAAMISKELRVSQRAALDLVAQLGVREITGRDRFRAWAVT